MAALGTLQWGREVSVPILTRQASVSEPREACLTMPCPWLLHSPPSTHSEPRGIWIPSAEEACAFGRTRPRLPTTSCPNRSQGPLLAQQLFSVVCGL